MKLKINKEDISGSFLKIAKQVILDHNLEVNGTSVEICDIEFYWNDQNDHKDESTHRHKFQSGQLRPHGSGFDITLREGDAYGGILIRGVLVEGKPVYGPLRSAAAILSCGSKLLDDEGLRIKLVEKKEVTETYPIHATDRVGLGKNAGDHSEEKYRFVICDPSYLKGVKGEEALCKQMVEKGRLSREHARESIGYMPENFKK